MNIYMDCGEVKRRADEIISFLDDFYKNIKMLDNTIENMKTAWSGDDATNFFNTMKEKNIPELERLYEVLLNYSNFLQRIPNAYQILDEVFTEKKIEF